MARVNLLLGALGAAVLIAAGVGAETLLQFNGQTSYVEQQSFDKLSTNSVFSLTAWVWPDNESDELQAIFGVATANFKYTMTLGWGNSHFYYTDGIKEMPVYSISKFPRRTWHHVALTFERTDRAQFFDPDAGHTSHRMGKLYVNGVLEATFETRLFDLNKPTIIAGAEYSQYAKQRYFAGLMDELRLYRSTLSEVDAGELSFTESKPELAARQLVWRAAFGVYKNDPTDIHDKVVKGRNAASTDGDNYTIEIAYCDNVHTDVMPFKAIPALTPARVSPYTPDPALPGISGPLRGSTLDVTGGHFTYTRFFRVEMSVLPDGEWMAVPYTAVDQNHVQVAMPAMEYTGAPIDVAVRVSNGGTAYPGVTYQSFTFIYDYSLGEDWAASLIGAYTFDAKSWRSAEMAWDNLVNRADTVSRATRVANYGFGGPFQGPDRNHMDARGIAFALGERVALPPLATDPNGGWALCTWLYAETGSETIFHEADAHGTHPRNVLSLDASGGVHLDGAAFGASIRLHAWQFVCVSRASASGPATLYVSGLAVGSASPLPPSGSAPTQALLGKMLVGAVDDLWLWARAMAANEVSDMYYSDRRSVALTGEMSSHFTAETSAGVFDTAAMAPTAARAFSVQLWARPLALSGPQPLLQIPVPVSNTLGAATAAPVSHGIYIGLVGGRVLAQLALGDDGTGATAFGNAITQLELLTTPGEWVHISVVYTAAEKLAVYVDGVKVNTLPATPVAGNAIGNFLPNTGVAPSQLQPSGTASFTGGDLYVSATGAPMRLGYASATTAALTATAASFRGSLAEVRLWSIGLTDAQVLTTAACSPQASEAGLFASFLFDEGLGSSLVSGATAASATLTYSDTMLPFWEYAAYGTMANETVWVDSEVAGPGAALTTAGAGDHFTFQDRSTCRLLKKVGGDEVQVAMIGPQEGRECNWFGACLDHGDGTYTCVYNLTLCGTYSLRVEDASGLVEAGLYDSWTSADSMPEDPTQAFLRTAPAASMARGAPSSLIVRPGSTYAPKSFVYDEPDWLTGTDMYVAHKGVPAAFMLRSADFWGCPRSVGGDDWEVHTYGRHETEGHVDDLGDGRYKITYVPHLEGRTHLAVTLDGIHVDTDNGFEQGAIHTWNAHEDRRIGYTGSPWCVQVLPGNGSLVFDGLNHVLVPHAEGLSLDYEDWAADAWIMPPAGRWAHGTLFSKASAKTGQGYYLHFMEADGKPEVSIYVGGGETRTVRAETGIRGGKWTHVAASYTGDALRLHVNGKLAAEKTYDYPKTVRENSQDFEIGRGFVGHIDEVRLFKSDVSEMLAASHRLARCPAPREALAAYFSFNDGPAATTAHDYVTHGLEGALVGLNATNTSNVYVDADFAPAWSAMRAPSDYGVVDYPASIAESFSGDGLSSAIAGIPTTFAFSFWDRCGWDVVSDDVSVEAAMVEEICENEAHDSLTYPFDDEDGVEAVATSSSVAECTASATFATTYTPPSCGTLRLRVSLDGDLVEGFPLDVPVAPHPASSPATSEVVGLGSGVAGVTTSFTIIARDEFGCRRTSGDDTFEVLLTRISLGDNPDGVAFAGPDVVATSLPVADHGDGSYTVTLHPPAPGVYTVAVGLVQADGTHAALTDTKLLFNVAPAPWRSVHVEGEGPGPRYRSSTVRRDNYVYVFRGWSSDKEGLMDVWRYPLAASNAWRYRMSVTVAKPPLHAVAVTIDTAALIEAGKMRPDCGDVLFKAAGEADWEDEALPYWIDVTPGCGAPDTIFWLVPPASGAMVLFYGNPDASPPAQLAPSDLFPVWETFEDGADPDTGLPANWTFASTCWLPTGDPATFSVAGAPLKTWRGSASLQADAATRLGGGLMLPLPAPQSQYILRAAFYDSDAPASSHWISPDYDDCMAMENGKVARDQGRGLGVFTPSCDAYYTTTYPWAGSSAGRTAGWHILQLVSNGERVMAYVDSEPVADLPASTALDKVFIRAGGPDMDEPLPSMAAWDDVMVAHYDADAAVTLGEEAAVLYTERGFHPLYTHGTPPPPRTASSAVVYGDKVYLLGGYGTYGAYADSGASRGATSLTSSEDVVWTYDLVTKTYETQTPWGSARPSPRFDHVTAVDEESGMIYLFGGRSAETGELLSDMWAYSVADPSSAAWADLTPAYGPSGRFGGSAVAYKHLVLVFGGLVRGEGGAPATPSNELWVFDTMNGEWSDLTPTRSPAPRFGHAATMVGAQLYVYGGYDNKARFADVHKYDIAYNRWTVVRPDPGYSRPAEKSSLTAVAHEDMLIIFGGKEDTADAYSSDMWGINIY